MKDFEYVVKILCKVAGCLCWLSSEAAWKVAWCLGLAANKARKLMYRLGCVAWDLGQAVLGLCTPVQWWVGVLPYYRLSLYGGELCLW